MRSVVQMCGILLGLASGTLGVWLTGSALAGSWLDNTRQHNSLLWIYVSALMTHQTLTSEAYAAPVALATI